ncbi:MAG: sulfotransferase domain-containing protein [Methylococcaceae bacterium]|nr:sulfotransferase domain-containing protein [Methylococcaceae bacterium]
MANKPDFIIIGAMKCATSSIHTQLALQPGIFMSTPKEPNFFSDDDHYARGLSWYESLFAEAKSGDLCGESSTHYTKLPDYPGCIARMKAYLPELKLVYVMRHPIDRLVSHYIHQWSQNVFTCDINQAIDQYEELIAYSSYARQLEPYIQAFGKNNILPVFFEAVKARPQQELQCIANFIGYDKPVAWVEELAQQNASNERVRRFPGYDLLVDSPIMTSLRRVFVPQFIRNKIKKNLTMQNRPVLDANNTERLIATFDKDLAILGDWLNLDLNCANFAKTALSDSPIWR